MKKKIFISIIIIIVAFFVIKQLFFSGKARQGMKMPSPMVTLATVERKNITESKEYIGRVDAKEEVQIVPHVDGYIIKKYVARGAIVNKGDLLYLIEPDEYEATVYQAKADIVNMKATLWESQKNLERAKELVDKDYISKSEYDNKLAIRDRSKAALEYANANLKRVSHSLEHTRIYAPISGKIGGVVTEGNLVGPSTGALTTISKLDPIYVKYHISADEFTQLRLKLSKEGKSLDNYKIKLEFSDGTAYPIEGKYYSYDNKVDETTGTIEITTLFSNPEGILLPGTMANVVMSEDKEVKKTVIPQSAVLEDTEGKYIYTLDKENKAEIRRIKVGKQIKEDWIVEEGLTEGEKVIMKGLQSLRPGVEVMLAPPQGLQPAKSEAKNVQ
ncbi:MAG TPA: efflux RND transporter periplasmic adaptor subunit [Candidatus Gastranaerophilales bacterium]|nr:efflux RND transporter periplasmic adaptor subunit [Candidatus Gastranaerophilales bacterium]